MTYTYPYPHPAIATDIAIFTLKDGRLHAMLVERKADPFAGSWPFPAGFLILTRRWTPAPGVN